MSLPAKALAQSSELARLLRRERLERCEHPVTVGTDHGGRHVQAHRRKAGDGAEHRAAPGAPALIEQGGGGRHHVLLRHQDPQPARAEQTSRAEAGDTRTDDEHVGVIVHGLGGV
jgi:hypothetical protein